MMVMNKNAQQSIMIFLSDMSINDFYRRKTNNEKILINGKSNVQVNICAELNYFICLVYFNKDEENEDDDENEEIEELNDGISDSISKHTSSVTKNRSICLRSNDH